MCVSVPNEKRWQSSFVFKYHQNGLISSHNTNSEPIQMTKKPPSPRRHYSQPHNSSFFISPRPATQKINDSSEVRAPDHPNSRPIAYGHSPDHKRDFIHLRSNHDEPRCRRNPIEAYISAVFVPLGVYTPTHIHVHMWRRGTIRATRAGQANSAAGNDDDDVYMCISIYVERAYVCSAASWPLAARSLARSTE